ncbi:hybrid sensor histidine kinase/response regulator [Pedobacter agri]|uniref:hybrid sensor histidine kinase/response regulator n=1 Tax=Pedobacter agri TaxID=454586 RepID=UPI00278079BB|nr:ATP-binding protein [Pedobacter agri]MDQ1140479.1 signal transduction histidine kinase/FixJ family two-component response regulator [Pedobacter agri]
MAAAIQKRFFRAIKSKVIIGFLFACFALLLAWGISKFAFTRMLNTVEVISAPNDRLRLVNDLSHKIARLDQLQRDEAFNKQGDYNFLKESRRVRVSLDSLRKLYKGDSAQLGRIKSIINLLAQRDKQFVSYLQVRETLVNTKSFSNEVKKLNELVASRSLQTDSAILTTETTTSTTTVAPEEEEKSRGFLSKLFGKKKADVYKIINEEFKVKRDTLNAKAEDSIMKSMTGSLKNIELEQKKKSQKFIRREAELSGASNKLTNQILQILRQVEGQAVAQVDLNGIQAKQVVNDGITQITAIIITFFLLTVILLYLILADITKSNRYRRELELAKDEAEYHGKAKQRFLSNMSHEIRTPLQSILGYAEVISQQDHPKKKDIDAIYQSSIHLLQIVNEVLDYNRIISGEFSFNNQAFSVRKILDEVTAVVRPLAEKKSLRLVTNLDLGDVEVVKGDAFRLKQILFNLLGNAVKFTLKGEINLNVSCKKQMDNLHFHFTIKDTGIGFEEKDMTRIFNEFEQIESPEQYVLNQTGTGLGLPIVKSLIEAQGGRIHVKSKPGKGTTFNIYLTYQETSERIIDPLDLSHYAIVNPGTVWVIDDDQLILDLCGLIFERNKIPYKTFNQVADILHETPVPDLKYVLVDMRLPEMTGIELCHLLKKKLPANVKFYAITAQVLPEEREMVLSEGFDGLIMKPFQAADLLSIFEKTEILSAQPEFDFSSIEKMTFGDQQMLEKILNRFKHDCIEDAAELKKYLDEGNQDKSRLIVHRLAGRTAQMGSKTLAHDFRTLEIEIAEKGLLAEIKYEVLNQLKKLDALIQVMEEMEPIGEK